MNYELYDICNMTYRFMSRVHSHAWIVDAISVSCDCAKNRHAAVQTCHGYCQITVRNANI